MNAGPRKGHSRASGRPWPASDRRAASAWRPPATSTVTLTSTATGSDSRDWTVLQVSVLKDQLHGRGEGPAKGVQGVVGRTPDPNEKRTAKGLALDGFDVVAQGDVVIGEVAEQLRGSVCDPDQRARHARFHFG